MNEGGERECISWNNEREKWEKGSRRLGYLYFQFNKYLLFSSFVGGAVRYRKNTGPTNL